MKIAVATIISIVCPVSVGGVTEVELSGRAGSKLYLTHLLQSTVSRPIDRGKRNELLAAAAAGALLAAPVWSLRDLASQMGSSARILVYYFGGAT